MSDSVGKRNEPTSFRVRLIWFGWIFVPFAVAFIGAKSAPINSAWVASAWLIAAIVCGNTMQYLPLSNDAFHLLRRPTLQHVIVGMAIAIANFTLLSQLVTFVTGTAILWSGLYQERFAIAIAVALFSGLHEEVLCRVALLAILLRKLSPLAAIFAQALIFALMHFGPTFVERMPFHFASGVVFGLVAVRYGVVSSAAAHVTWNCLVLMFQGGVGPGYRLNNLWLNSQFQDFAPAIAGISWSFSAVILWALFSRVGWAPRAHALGDAKPTETERKK